MPVHDEMPIRSLFILTRASLDQRRVFQGREAEADIFASVFECFLIDHALTGRGIERLSARVVGDLEPAPPASRNPVAKAATVIAPYRQMSVVEAVISRWRSKKENILLGGLHKVPNRMRKQLSQPRPAGKHERVGLEK